MQSYIHMSSELLLLGLRLFQESQDSMLSRLTEAADDPSIRSLRLCGMSINSVLVSAVGKLVSCDNRQWEDVVVCACSGNIESLTKAIVLSNVQTFYATIVHGQVDDGIFSGLGSCIGSNSTLKSLGLKIYDPRAFNGIGFRMLAEGLRKNKHICCLMFERCPLSQANVCLLSRSLCYHPNLKKLFLSHSCLSDCSSIAQLIKSPGCRLSSLNLTYQRNSSSSSIGRARQTFDISLLSHALSANTSLRSLDLSGNLIGHDNLSILAESLAGKNNSLKELAMADCGIDNVGIGSLAKQLPFMNGLESMDLKLNKFGDDGRHKLFVGLSGTHDTHGNMTLKRLNCTCRLGDPTSEGIKYYLALNKAGRKKLVGVTAMKELIQILGSVRNNVRMLYYFLREDPGKWCNAPVHEVA